MLTDRLSFARDAGALVLPDPGRLCVFGARGDDDLSPLGADLQVVQGMKPEHDALAARGVDVAVAPSGEFAGALVVLPRARDLARDLVARAVALARGGPVWIDGQKTDGVDAMIRSLRAHGTVDPVISKAHGKLFRFEGRVPDDWRAGETVLPSGFVTRPGVFSADAPDRGSELLAELLPEGLKGTVADLGAGWGYLAARILERPGVTALHLVEADHAALECARANVRDPRAVFHWADATRARLPDPVDHVVMNPPFHTGRKADPALGRAFIAAAAGLLKPAGQLWLVANRHLPYESVLSERFAKSADLSNDPAFKVIHAERPRRAGRPRA
ncbi:class I SAM-dependent methyltransferase [Oceaniglobus roseus]|uniref:class I SAM-dependent methyltransferase n=1 Tax=Oceaniglobus roseus TaxID=1737570 RepID=UPI000C7EC584|nr:class I SAM-dependent methyltransferase [Kandeliimicrobium roseum]